MPPLRPGLSFCEVGNRLIFLDLRRDRYFCLLEEAEHAFRLGMRAELSGTAPELSFTSLVTAEYESHPTACRPPLQLDGSCWDDACPSVGAAATLGALVAVTRVRARLVLHGLAATVARIEKRRHIVPQRAADRCEVVRAVAPFVAVSKLVSTRDACLPHSLAIVDRLVRVGQPAQLVFGVRLGPFAAHCWVQQGSLVVNDRVDVVRTFTPILVA